MTHWRRPRLPHRRTQTILAVAGLGAAVALPAILLAVGGGVFRHEIGALAASGFQVVVSASGAHGIGGAHGLADRIASIPGVAQVSPALSAAVEVFAGPVRSPALAEGIVPFPFLSTQSPQESALFPHPLPLGDPMDRAHWANGTYRGPSVGSVLISTPFASALGLQIGGTLRIGLGSDPNGSLAFRVTGFFGAEGPSIGPTAVFGLLLPLSDLQSVAGLARAPNGALLDSADTIEVGLTALGASHPSDIDRVAEAVRQMVPYYSVVTIQSEAARLAAAEAVLNGFYLGLSAVGVAIGAAFLTLVLFREVESERRSYGIRRALGLPARSIWGGILARSWGLSVLGSLSGLGGGYLTVGILAAAGGGSVATVSGMAYWDPLTLIELVGVVLLLGGAAGSAAARRALRPPLSELLR